MELQKHMTLKRTKLLKQPNSTKILENSMTLVYLLKTVDFILLNLERLHLYYECIYILSI